MVAAVRAVAKADPERVVEAFTWLGGWDPELAERAAAALRYVTGVDSAIPEHLRNDPDALAVREAAGTWEVPVTDLGAFLPARGSGDGGSR